MAALQPRALLVVTDTTQGMEFGIDTHVWTLGAKFEGLHSIAEGLRETWDWYCREFDGKPQATQAHAEGVSVSL